MKAVNMVNATLKPGIGYYLIHKDSEAKLKPENQKEQHSFNYQEKQKRSPIRIVGSFKNQPDVACVKCMEGQTPFQEFDDEWHREHPH